VRLDRLVAGHQAELGEDHLGVVEVVDDRVAVDGRIGQVEAARCDRRGQRDAHADAARGGHPLQVGVLEGHGVHQARPVLPTTARATPCPDPGAGPRRFPGSTRIASASFIRTSSVALRGFARE